MGREDSGGGAGRESGYEFCCGPGVPYEEGCLGNGRTRKTEGKASKRCPKCKVERRRRHMAQRNRERDARVRRRRKSRREAPRPTTLDDALREADSVFSAQQDEARDKHPAVHWETVRRQTNDGRTLTYDRIDLRHSIHRN